MIKTEVDRLVGRSVGRSKRSELLIVSRTWSFNTSTFFVRVQAIAWCSSSSVIWRWLLSLFTQFWSLRSTLVAVLFFRVFFSNKFPIKNVFKCNFDKYCAMNSAFHWCHFSYGIFKSLRFKFVQLRTENGQYIGTNNKRDEPVTWNSVHLIAFAKLIFFPLK